MLSDIDSFSTDHNEHPSEWKIEDISGFLYRFVRGLGGREFDIVSDSSTFTDTERLHLPSALDVYPISEKNFTLYKLTAAHLWAQTWYGTWRYQIIEKLTKNSSVEHILPIFNILECVRLDSCISRDLPGLYREFEALGYKDAQARTQWRIWRERASLLLRPDATSEDSLNVIDQFKELKLPPPKYYQGDMFIFKVHKTMLAQINQEKTKFQRALHTSSVSQKEAISGDTSKEPAEEFIEIKKNEDGKNHEETGMQLFMNGDVIVTNQRQEIIGSILQDFEGTLEEHLNPIDLGEHNKNLQPNKEAIKCDASFKGNSQGFFKYREWDCFQQKFLYDFCTLRELEIKADDELFAVETLKKHRGLLKSIKRTMEGVLDDSRLQRRQRQGDDIDLDAIVEGYAEMAAGREMGQRLYTRYLKKERNIAVMFIVDMSGSTLGWINQAERESLLLLCEALEMLGDHYAIFGFSGSGSKNCEVYRIKDFDQVYDLQVRQRISGMRPKSYTRMGVAIRHLGHLLNLTHARTKLLITLSDGRPEDCDGYKGRYGIEDTRHALLEMKENGIHPFCITIDDEALEYLPHMFGSPNYVVIDEVQKLPKKIAEIYSRLTT